MKHGYPGSFMEEYDRLQREATALGVCPKVCTKAGGGGQGWHYCGKPLEEGKRWCWLHHYGV